MTQKLKNNLIWLIVALSALFGFSYLYWQHQGTNSTPKTLVVQAMTAAQKGDLSQFEAVVDVPSLADYIVTNAYKEAFKNTDNIESIDSLSMLQQMAPDLKKAIAVQIRDIVSNPKQRDLLTPWQQNLSFVERIWSETLGSEEVVYKIKLKNTDDKPYVSLEMSFPENPERIYNLVIGFKETDEGLKLASLPNLAQFLASFEPLRKEREKFYKARIEQQIKESLKITTTEPSASEGSWGEGRNIFVGIGLENLTEETIIQIKGDIVLKRGVQYIKAQQILDTDPIAPAQLVEKTYNIHFEPLSDETALIEAALKGNLGVSADVEIKEVHFENGQILKL